MYLSHMDPKQDLKQVMYPGPIAYLRCRLFLLAIFKSFFFTYFRTEAEHVPRTFFRPLFYSLNRVSSGVDTTRKQKILPGFEQNETPFWYTKG